MKLAYTLLPLLLGISLIIQQNSQPKGVGQIESRYDRDADMTTVQCDLLELGKGAPRLVVQANASFRGKEPNETAIFWLSLSSYRGSATRRTKPLFKETKTVLLYVDSDRIEVPAKDYRNDFYELNRLFAEQAHAELGRESLKKLLDAQKLEGKWGEVEFKFSGDSLASLKEFISRQVFAGNGR
jgi:hypothetical protein